MHGPTGTPPGARGGRSPAVPAGGGVPFPGMSVFFVSREPVRSPQPLHDFAAVAASLAAHPTLSTVPGSLSVPSQNRWVVASCPGGLGKVTESAMVELYEYDPVRYQALVIGLVEPPPETPVHWIYRRVNPSARAVAVLKEETAEGREVREAETPRGYLGNTDTLLQLGKLLRGADLLLVHGLGVVAGAADGKALSETIAKALSPATGG